MTTSWRRVPGADAGLGAGGSPGLNCTNEMIKPVCFAAMIVTSVVAVVPAGSAAFIRRYSTEWYLRLVMTAMSRIARAYCSCRCLK